MKDELIERIVSKLQYMEPTDYYFDKAEEHAQAVISTVLDAQAQNFAEIRNCLSVIMLSDDKQVQEYSARLLKELEAINKLR